MAVNTDTVTHLRKTFRFPDDENNVDPAEGIDEEEQEKVIESLKKDDANQTATYRKLVLAIPILAIFFVPHTLPLRNTIPTTFLVLLSLTLSFLATYTIPLAQGTTATPAAHSAHFETSNLSTRSPWMRYLHLADNYAVPANGLVCAVLLLSLYSTRAAPTTGRNDNFSGTWWRSLALPFIVFAITVVTRRELRPLDVTELEGMRYEYKGA